MNEALANLQDLIIEKLLDDLEHEQVQHNEPKKVTRIPLRNRPPRAWAVAQLDKCPPASTTTS